MITHLFMHPLERTRMAIRHRMINSNVLGHITHTRETDTAEVIIFFPAGPKEDQKEEKSAMKGPQCLTTF